MAVVTRTALQDSRTLPSSFVLFCSASLVLYVVKCGAADSFRWTEDS